MIIIKYVNVNVFQQLNEDKDEYDHNTTMIIEKNANSNNNPTNALIESPHLQQLLAILPQSEQFRILQKKHLSDQKRGLFGQLLIRGLALEMMRGWAVDDDITETKNGKFDHNTMNSDDGMHRAELDHKTTVIRGIDDIYYSHCNNDDCTLNDHVSLSVNEMDSSTGPSFQRNTILPSDIQFKRTDYGKPILVNASYL